MGNSGWGKVCGEGQTRQACMGRTVFIVDGEEWVRKSGYGRVGGEEWVGKGKQGMHAWVGLFSVFVVFGVFDCMKCVFYVNKHCHI